ncbi:MAG TPA: vitamin K epoxide reductase family protein [Bellilinea sp.]|nr:vitamin K epoxide reductase family protein [Bellilinea sp.]
MNKLNKVFLITNVIGLIDAIYLIIVKFANNKALCIQGIGDCWSVNTSRYSTIAGIPLSVIGTLGYLVILLIHLNLNRFEVTRKYGLYALFGLTLGGFIFSIYLTYLEIAVIKAICPFCVVSAIAMTVLFVVSILRLFKADDD